MRTNAYDNSGTTKISEIQTQRGDILFGTFRMSATVPDTPGVVFGPSFSSWTRADILIKFDLSGFFSYNGTAPNAEADIEFRSSDSNLGSTVHYSTQPSASMVSVPRCGVHVHI